MKKQLLTMAAFTLIAASVSAQQAAKINGQPFGQGDWFGSNNNEAVIFKANNNVGFKIKPNGEVVLKSLDLNSSIGSNGLVLTDGQGKLFRLNFPNDASKVLLGDGTFGVLPSAPQWLSSGNNLYWNAGNVSIGSVPNSFKLNVEGDVRVSHDLFVNNNMYVGGGIVISDKIQGVTEVKGWDFKVENDIQVTGTSRFNGATQLDQTLAVNGDATFENALTAKKGVMFDAVNGIRYTAPTATTPAKYNLGGSIYQPSSTACPTPHQNWQYFATQGAYISHIPANTPGASPTVNASLTMMTAPWDGSGLIEVDGTDANGGTGNGLLINYFCGRSVEICTGANKGRVTVGDQLQANKNVRIGNFGNDPFDPNISLSIAQNNPNTTALKLNVYEGTVRAIDLVNPGNQISNFTVWQNGKTEIKSYDENPFDVINPATGKSNFRVKNTGVVYSREVNVQLTDYPDYVFAKNYSLMPLDILSKYIDINKHLPNVPSAKEIEANGANLGELNKIQMEKIEELTLYIIEIKKELEALKLQVNNGK